MQKTMNRKKLCELCIKNKWFTGGNFEQYEKLFYANDTGYPIDEIATIIWICSTNWSRSDILRILKENLQQ